MRAGKLRSFGKSLRTPPSQRSCSVLRCHKTKKAYEQLPLHIQSQPVLPADFDVKSAEFKSPSFLDSRHRRMFHSIASASRNLHSPFLFFAVGWKCKHEGKTSVLLSYGFLGAFSWKGPLPFFFLYLRPLSLQIHGAGARKQTFPSWRGSSGNMGSFFFPLCSSN